MVGIVLVQQDIIGPIVNGTMIRGMVSSSILQVPVIYISISMLVSLFVV